MLTLVSFAAWRSSTRRTSCSATTSPSGSFVIVLGVSVVTLLVVLYGLYRLIVSRLRGKSTLAARSSV